MLAGVATASYTLGVRTERQRQAAAASAASAEPAHSGQQTAPAVAAATERPTGATRRAVSSSEAELLGFVAQLPAKPLGPKGGAVHSTAKVVLLCASGKGGVGKSTVSVNFAYTLAGMGLDVGLLDLDVYGPSLPELIPLPAGSVMQNSKGRIIPLDYGGVALMSWGYVQPGEAATIRAPILAQIVSQLLTEVEWGALDVLVIDTPPGTGDVLLSLSQTLPIDGAVLVTTCNNISFADVLKGVQLFEKVAIPPLFVVANMATFACDGCGREHQLFADGAAARLPGFLEEKGIGLMKMPLDPVLSKTPGRPVPPVVFEYPFARNPDNQHRPAWKSFCNLAHAVLEKLLGMAEDGGAANTAPAGLKLRPGGMLEVRLKGGELRPVAAAELRAACRCAHCIDEFTGELKIDRDLIRSDTGLRAATVEAKGNYAVSVTFSDGHNSLVALRALEQMVGAGVAAGPLSVAAGGGGGRTGDW